MARRSCTPCRQWASWMSCWRLWQAGTQVGPRYSSTGSFQAAGIDREAGFLLSASRRPLASPTLSAVDGHAFPCPQWPHTSLLSAKQVLGGWVHAPDNQAVALIAAGGMAPEDVPLLNAREAAADDSCRTVPRPLLYFPPTTDNNVIRVVEFQVGPAGNLRGPDGKLRAARMRAPAPSVSPPVRGH
jgi:hypothetical protein